MEMEMGNEMIGVGSVRGTVTWPKTRTSHLRLSNGLSRTLVMMIMIIIVIMIMIVTPCVLLVVLFG